MLGWLKAKQEQRQKEGDCDFIIAGLLHTKAQAEVEIRRLETEVDPSVRRGAAVQLMQVVIDCPRTVEDVKSMKTRAEESYASGKMRLQHYIGRQLGLRLVGGGALLLNRKRSMNHTLASAARSRQAPLSLRSGRCARAAAMRSRRPTWPSEVP
jgi:hypothetical protein